jgi:hypothetical protein
MPFVTRLLHTGWRVQAKRDWANSPNEWAILRPSANGTTWKRSLERKVRVGLRFGAQLVLPRPADISFGAYCQSCLVSFSDIAASLIEFDPRILGLEAFYFPKGFRFRFSGNPDIEKARAEFKRAQKIGYPDLSVFQVSESSPVILE